MVKKTKKTTVYSALEVANICGVVNQTAINWIHNGGAHRRKQHFHR